MTLPVFLFGLTTAFLLGSLFHALRGGGGWQFLLSLISSTLGFALGQLAGWWFGFVIYSVGSLDVGLGGIGSIVLLVVGDWLSRIKPQEKSGV